MEAGALVKKKKSPGFTKVMLRMRGRWSLAPIAHCRLGYLGRHLSGHLPVDCSLRGHTWIPRAGPPALLKQENKGSPTTPGAGQTKAPRLGKCTPRLLKMCAKGSRQLGRGPAILKPRTILEDEEGQYYVQE